MQPETSLQVWEGCSEVLLKPTTLQLAQITQSFSYNARAPASWAVWRSAAELALICRPWFPMDRRAGET